MIESMGNVIYIRIHFFYNIPVKGRSDSMFMLLWIYIINQIKFHTFSGGDSSEGLARCSLIWSSSSPVVTNL